VLVQREMDFSVVDLAVFRTGASPQTPRFSEAWQEALDVRFG